MRHFNLGKVLGSSLLVLAIVLLAGCPLHTRRLCLPIVPPVTGLTGLTNSKAAWGDYDNDGQLDMVVAGFDSSNNPRTILYHNDGAGNFSVVAGTGFINVGAAALAWGDWDNDGFIDLIVTGTNSSAVPVTKFYINNQDGTFTDSGQTLPNVYGGAVGWADYDHDGRIDLAIMGLDSSNAPLVEVFHNDSDGTLTDSLAGLPQVNGTLAWIDDESFGQFGLVVSGTQDGLASDAGRVQIWSFNGVGNSWNSFNASNTNLMGTAVSVGDYNNDGYPDFALSGLDTSNNPFTLIFQNGQDAFFNEIDPGLTPVSNGSLSWGDFDNDGKIDLIVEGGATNLASSGITTLYHNDGNDVFSASAQSFTGLFRGSVAFADFNNDGALDLVLTGADTANQPFFAFVQSTTGTVNTIPTAPISVFASVNNSNSSVNIFFGSNSDAETPVAGLSYNVRIGTTPGGDDIVSPMADPVTGFRRIVGIGNAGQTNNFDLGGLPDGTYFYSVQAIDGSWAGGDWSTEQSFTILFTGA